MTTKAERLAPHEMRAVEKLSKLRVGALYMELPMGKFRILSALIRERLESGRIAKTLWLYPCSMRGQLDRETRGLPGGLRERISFHGLEQLSHNGKLFAQLMTEIRREAVMLVVDGSSLIKNPEALRTKRVAALARECPYRFLISQTPFTNNIADMFSQWAVLDWRIFGYRTYWSFSCNHLTPEKKGKNIAYLVDAIQPYSFQITKADVMESQGKTEYIWQFQLPEETMRYYREVVKRFAQYAAYSRTGVYRLLHASQHVVCGRKITGAFPLKTAPMYGEPEQNPRLKALREVLGYFPGQRILILCRYAHEAQLIVRVLNGEAGREECAYCRRPEDSRDGARILIQVQMSQVHVKTGWRVNAVIYYSQHWSWETRRSVEEMNRPPDERERLMVVSLVAAGTIDRMILHCVWRKENLVRHVKEQLQNKAFLS